ncbi:MAG: glycosyltransferase family 39 protein, partial [Candidatus Nanoarchaeia archaeon]
MKYFNLKPIPNIIVPILLFFITFAWFSVFAIRGIDPHHDGMMLKPAMDVADGKILFRDTFTQYGALTTYLQALALKIFGKYLIVIRSQTVLFYSASVIVLYFIWKNFLSPTYLVLAYMLFLILPPFYEWTFLPWSSVYALFFMLLANLCIIAKIKKEVSQLEKKSSLFLILLAGIFSALAFWCRQPCGLVMLIAFGLFYFARGIFEPEKRKNHFNDFCRFIFAFVVTCLIFLVDIARNDALVDWYYQSIRMLFTFAGNELSKTPNWWECFFPNSPYVLFPVASMFFLLLSFSKIADKKVTGNEKAFQAIIMITALIALGSWHQYFPVPCKRHFYWAAIPMIGFYAMFMEKIVSEFFRGSKKIFYVITCLVLLSPFISITVKAVIDIKNSLTDTTRKYWTEETPFKYMNVSGGQYLFYKKFLSIVAELSEKYKNKNWLNLTDDAIFSAIVPSNR